MTQLYAIQLDTEIDPTYELAPKSKGIWGFSRVNLFCGSNNCGKSRFLRWMFTNKIMNGSTYLADSVQGISNWNQTKSLIKLFAQHMRSSGGQFKDSKVYEIFENVGKGNFDPSCIRVMLHDESYDPEFFAAFKRNGTLQKHLQAVLESYKSASHVSIRGKSVYIPSVRTCRAIASDSDIFDHVKKSYFMSNKPNRITSDNLFVGRDLYDLIRARLLGGPSQRDQVSRFEKFLSEYFFEGSPVSLMPREPGADLYIRVFPEKERKVAELGDGLQQLVILFAPLFLLETDCLYMFIEEPELYLHPGMQRRMMQVLLSDFGNVEGMPEFQIFMTTHSNHLLDMRVRDEDISVYRFQKKEYGEISSNTNTASYEQDPKVVIHNSQPGDFELLGDLGVARSSVFLANCTVWVEGPTDRRLIQKYIQIVQDNCPDYNYGIYEDRDYAFVLYGGSILGSWKFLSDDGPDAKYLCSDAVIVCDGDIKDENKGSRLALLQENVGEENVIVLPCREIENSISYRLLSGYVLDKGGIEQEDYVDQSEQCFVDQHLGNFVQSMHPDKTKLESWRAKDGGLKDYRKGKLGEYAIDNMKPEDVLGGVGEEIAKAIIDFVHTKNK